MSAVRSVFVLIGASLAFAADSSPKPVTTPSTDPVLLIGVLNTGGDSDRLFALGKVGTDGKVWSLGWKRIGDRVEGVRLVSYEPKGELLFVQDGTGAITRLALKESRVGQSALPTLTREQAKAYLANVVALETKKALTYSAEANLDFDVDRNATPEERAEIAKARSIAAQKGTIFLIARREDGTLTSYISPPYPRDLPQHISTNLTDADWKEFDLAYAIASFRSNEDRKKSLQQAPVPQKAGKK